jgi:hypothetical protein
MPRERGEGRDEIVMGPIEEDELPMHPIACFREGHSAAPFGRGAPGSSAAARAQWAVTRGFGSSIRTSTVAA